MVKFLADENFPGPIVKALRALGHDVAVLAASDRQSSDAALLAFSLSQQRVLLTQDKDFARLVIKDRHPCWGLVHLSVTNKGGWKTRAFGLAERLHARADDLPGTIAVLTETDMSVDRF